MIGGIVAWLCSQFIASTLLLAMSWVVPIGQFIVGTVQVVALFVIQLLITAGRLAADVAAEGVGLMMMGLCQDWRRLSSSAVSREPCH